MPEGCGVVPGSLPVVAFGDPANARVATVSLNPSWHEFLDPSGAFLLGAHRRLASLRSLNVSDPRDLTDDQVARVVTESNSYFQTPNWYRRWFRWLEQLLSHSGAGSYLDGTACHLDLVQWATKPAQGNLARDVWEMLVRDDRDFLAWQLEAGPVQLVLLNGASVVREVERAGLIPHLDEEVLPCRTRESSVLRVFQADAGRVRYLGWNRPLAGPLPASCRERLASWVTRALTPTLTAPQVQPRQAQTPRTMSKTSMPTFEDGHIPKGTTVHSLDALQDLLAKWTEHTTTDTLGDTANRHGVPLITVTIGADTFRINNDTTRRAVLTFLTAADRAEGAANLPWHITTTARAALRRVTYRPDNARTPGWYAYLPKPTATPRPLKTNGSRAPTQHR